MKNLNSPSVAYKFFLLMSVALIGVALLASGCAQRSSGSADSNIVPAPTPPPPPELSTPKTAVVSYQYWISYAYRIGNSEVASQTFSPNEEVRVNSYVEYLISEPKHLIDQKLMGVKVKKIASEDNTATVAIHEDWDYRYISLTTKRWEGPPLKASYETTYTVLRGEDGKWRVDSVEAQPVGKIK